MGKELLVPKSQMCSAIFDYDAQPKESICCPLCGWVHAGLPVKDRYGYDICVSACHCGLTYINPRMSPETYATFYADGTYRRLVQAFQPRSATGDKLSAHQRMYGERIAWYLRGLKVKQAVDVLDAGGGDGSVLDGMSRTMTFQSVTVLDPCGTEVEQAKAKGYRTITGTLETLAGATFGGIVCAETLDHLCDPVAALTAMRAACSGWLWVDFVEMNHWKIDHPLYWTIRGLENVLKRTDWKPKTCFRYPAGVGFRTAVVCE